MSAGNYEERCQGLDVALQNAIAEWLPDPDAASDQEVTDGLAGAISVAGGVFLGLVAGANSANLDLRRLAAKIIDRLIRLNPELEAGERPHMRQEPAAPAGGGYGGGRAAKGGGRQ